MILKVRWENGNAHSFDNYIIGMNFGNTFLEAPLGNRANYSINTTEGASCLGSDISHLRDFAFRKSKAGWLEVFEYKREFGETYGTAGLVTVTHYKLVQDREPVPGFPDYFLKPVKKYITKEKHCNVRELMK